MPHLPHSPLSPIHPPRPPDLLCPPPTQAPLQPHHRATNLIPQRRLLLLHHHGAVAESEARAARGRYDDFLGAVAVRGATPGGGGAVPETGVGGCAVGAGDGGGALFAAEA